MVYPWTESIGIPHAVAVLSTRSGSGATLLTAAAGLIIDDAVGRVGQSVILMDADTRRGGLTALTRHWNTTSVAAADGLRGFAAGAVDLADRPVHPHLLHVLTGMPPRQDMALFPLGPKGRPGPLLPTGEKLQELVGVAVERLMDLHGCLIVDCGSGRTPVAMEVCRRVEHVILVGSTPSAGDGETGPTLAWLTARGLGGKVLGYVHNDPDGARHQRADAAGERTPLMRLPYDRDGARTVAGGRLPARNTPLVRALCEQMLAQWPDVLNDGARGAR